MKCNAFFYNDILPGKERTNLLASYLRNIRFFTFKTLLFIIKINAYNVNKNVFINLQLIFEQNDVGKIYTTYKLCTLNILNDISNLFPTQFKMNIILNFMIFPFIIIFTIYNLFDILKETIHSFENSTFICHNKEFRLGKAFKDIWFYFKILQTSLFFITVIMRIYLYSTVKGLFQKSKENNSYVDIEGKCGLLETITLLETFIICCTLIYFLRYLERNIIKPVYDTIIQSYRQIIIFFCSYFLVILGFSYFCNYIYGVREQSKIFNLTFIINLNFRQA